MNCTAFSRYNKGCMVDEFKRPISPYLQNTKEWIWWYVPGGEKGCMAVLQRDELYEKLHLQ